MPDPTTRLNAALEGHYRIEGELGAGGMATVYLAEDLKHDRKVALKVLRPELTAVLGGDRFIQEIKTTAGLQHPHILPLFDSGEADGFLFYVMPFVEGESLRAKLDRERQLDIDEALHIAKAVASALQYAHDRDVIHRDIKPENILLHAGEPVVADFGIALAISAAGGGRMTETGLSLGTPHYMSPEQASADRDLTVRSDVYSLACVLYEMLAGQPPHTGPTAQSILVRILTEEPRPVTDLRQAVPGHVAAVVSKGLEKLPADRFRKAEELGKALDDPSFTHLRGDAGAAVAHGGGRMPRTRSRSPWTVAHSAVTGILALATVWLAFGGRGGAPPIPEGPPVAFVARDTMPGGDFVAVIEVGADGTVAFAPPDALFVRRPGALEATRLIDAEWAEFAFSPDGEEIVTTLDFPGSGLWKVPVNGGAPVIVSSGWDQVIGMPVWGEDGWIYFVAGESVPTRSALHRVPEVGGDAELLLEVPGSALAPTALLPGGRALLYTQLENASEQSRVMLLDLEGRDTTELVGAGSQARWSPTGHLVYGHPSGALWAIPFDLDRLRVTGPPVPVQEDVHVGAWWTHYGLNRSGTLAYMTGGSLWTFTLVDEVGNRETLPIQPSDHFDIAISSDGRFAAYTREDDIHIIDLDRGSDFALTEGRSGPHSPVWSPDGSRVAYLSPDGVRVRPVDRSTEPRLLPGTSILDSPRQWPEAGTIILTSNEVDVAAVRVDGEEPPRMLLQADWMERGPSVSPDGRWLAYVSDRGGATQLYVRSWPDLEAETRISAGDAEVSDMQNPEWSPDSGTLYYVEGQQLIAADVRAEEGLVVEGWRRLPGQVTGYLLGTHPDGRLLVAEPAGSTGQVDGDDRSRLIVVVNWFTQLRERLGGS
ncbi:MAG: protein kinase [Gemmatimonadota bacterium]